MGSESSEIPSSRTRGPPRSRNRDPSSRGAVSIRAPSRRTGASTSGRFGREAVRWHVRRRQRGRSHARTSSGRRPSSQSIALWRSNGPMKRMMPGSAWIATSSSRSSIVNRLRTSRSVSIATAIVCRAWTAGVEPGGDRCRGDLGRGERIRDIPDAYRDRVAHAVPKASRGVTPQQYRAARPRHGRADGHLTRPIASFRGGSAA
jgi:hypothetical protein